MIYKVVLSRAAEKELFGLPRQQIPKVIENIMSLQENPCPQGCKKLKGKKEELWRIRIGDYRVLYSIDDVIRIVDIRKIGHRKDVYEG